MNNKEHQRAFKERMYARGYKQKIVWVKRDGESYGKGHIDRLDFIRRMDSLTAGISTARISKVYKQTLDYIIELVSLKPSKAAKEE
jgi:hypothetical protein